MPHNDPTPGDGSSVTLSENANLQLGQDEEKTAQAVDSITRQNTRAVATPEQAEAYNKYVDEFGVQPASKYSLVDWNKPVGDGTNGTRQTVRPEDITAAKIFALDQGMADNDQAYSPTFESIEAAYLSTEYVNHAIQQTQNIDPELAYQLAIAERFLALYPELAVITRNGFGFAGITEQILADMMPDIEALGTNAEVYVNSSDTLDQFLNDFGDQIDPGVKKLIYISLAPLSTKEQTHMAALGAAYIDARALETLEDQLNFATWFGGESESIFARESDQSFWGKFGRVGAHVFTNPANYIQDEIIGSVWSSATDPADAWYRNELTLEETMALSLGQDPGTTGWATFTGLAGVGIDVFIDPTNIFLAGLSGFKLAKTAALIDDFAALSKTQRIVSVGLPFGGKGRAIAAGLPKGLRGRSSRIAWAAFGKTQDGMVAVAKKKGVFKAIAEATSYAALTDEIPELRKAPTDLIDMMVKSTDEDYIEALYSAAFKGDFLDPQSTVHRLAQTAEIESENRITAILQGDALGRVDDLNAGDVIGAKGGGVWRADMPIELDEVAFIAARSEDTAEPVARTDVNAFRNIKGIAQKKLNETEGALESATPVGGGVFVSNLSENGVDTIIAWKEMDDGPEVVGALIGTVANKTEAGGYTVAVAEDLRRTGIGSALTKASGRTPEQLASGVNSISEDGAALLNAGRSGKLVNVGTTATPDSAAVYFLDRKLTNVVKADDGSVKLAEIKSWIRKNTKHKKDGINTDGTINRNALYAYMDAHDVHAVRFNNGIVIRNADQLEKEGRLMRFANGDAANRGLADAVQAKKKASLQLRVNATGADQVGKWIVADMPIKVRSAKQDYKFWRSQYGVFAGTKYSEANFLVRRLRGLVSKVFVDDVPASIATGWNNRTDGVNDLRRLLVQMGVDPDFARRSIDEYMENPTREVVTRIIRDAGDDIGDAEIALGLMRFQDKAFSELEYAVINGGEQLTNGKRVDGTTGLQPLMSSQTSDFVQLPDSRAFSAHLRRVKRSTNRVFKIRNRGYGKTNATRRKLIDDFGRRLESDATAKASWNALSEDDKYAVAYAVVRPKDSTLADGLGYAAKFGQQLSEVNTRLRNVFSIAMLAWRPIGWMGNEMLDNTWRGAMAGSMSFFRHPFQSMGAAMDAKRIQTGLRERAIFLRLTEDVMTAAKTADNPTAMLDEVAKIIPDVRKYVNTADDLPEQEKVLRAFMNNEIITQSDVIPVLDDPLAQALHRQRKGQAAASKYNIPEGQAGDLYDPDWDDISLTGWENQFADNMSSASMRHQWVPGRQQPPETLRGYIAAWHSTMARDVRDPAIRMYLRQAADVMAGGTDNTRAARAYLNSPAHNKMREPIANMIRGAGLDPDNMDDMAQVQWYFSQKIKPYVEDQFGFLLTESNARTLARGQGSVVVNGESFLIDLDDQDTIRDIVLAANGSNLPMPESVVGLINPTTLYGQKASKGWKTPLRSYNNWALQKFGHDIPVNVQRRPAFIRSMGRYSRQYEAMGMTPEAAQIVAKQKSMQLINTSFFFLDAQTPFLKSMNRLIPFYAAQWEVIKAWTWKVPTLSNYAGVGHARMLRSFDHIFNAFRRNGLLQPRYNNDGKVDGWDLQFASDPHTDNAVGSVVSKAGHLALMAPAMLLEQMGEIVTGNDLDLTSDEINFNFNHPYDFFTRRGGVLPTARLQFGINPYLGYPAAKIRQQLPFTSGSEQITTTAEENLAVWLGDNEVSDPKQFLTANGAALVKAGALTEEELSRAKGGSYGLSNIEIPKGVDLFVPRTTLIARMVDSVLFPYGQSESIAEGMSGFVPSVIQNTFKSMALYQNNGDIEGLSAWATPWVMGPTGRYGMGTAYVDAAASLEMRTGIFSEQRKIAEALAAIPEDEATSPRALALQSELEDIDDLITSEVRDAAASAAFVQTLYGVIMPFNPKRPTESQTLRSYYFNGKTAADQWAQGKPVAMPFDGNSAMDTYGMIAAWGAGETGSEAKMEFLRQQGGSSSMLAAIAPRSYWGASGLPVQAENIETYFRQVETGERQPLPLDVWNYRFQGLAIQIEKEMLIIEEFGNDPEAQALAILQNNYAYKLVTEEMDNKYRALDLMDDLVNDNAYAEWKERNGSESYLDYVADEQEQRIEALQVVLSEIELDLFPDDPNEARDISGKLKGLRNNLYSIGDLYQDERYADYAVGPRQEILNSYYDKLGDYFDELSNMYDSISGAANADEQSAIYSSIARFRNAHGRTGLRLGFTEYPAPETYTWNAKSPEVQKSIIDSKLDGKFDWLTELDVSHYIDVYPESERFMPTSLEAQALFEWKRQQDAALARMVGPEGDNFGDNIADARKELNEEFKQRLADEGEFGVLESIGNYPIENAKRYGALPLLLEPLVPRAIAIHRELDATGSSPLTKKGKEQQRYMYEYVLQVFANNPTMESEFVVWGIRAFEETSIEGIVAKMLGNYTGKIG